MPQQFKGLLAMADAEDSRTIQVETLTTGAVHEMVLPTMEENGQGKCPFLHGGEMQQQALMEHHGNSSHNAEAHADGAHR